MKPKHVIVINYGSPRVASTSGALSWVWWRAMLVSVLIPVLSAVLLLTGCLQRPIGVGEPQTTNLVVSRITQTAVDKIDLLLMIDNSLSMSDKQSILQLAVPVLVERLVNPACVAEDGSATRPTTADEPCPGSASRQFPPLKDIHVGIITSSMGDAGANQRCAFDPADPDTAQTVDKGYLLGSLERGGGKGPGFLTWDGTDLPGFETAFHEQIGATGEQGCGFEASMEAWYHFLVDPAPWSDIDTVDCAGEAAGTGRCRAPRIVQPDGTRGDPVILAQRQAFLRPDSLVAIVMLTDENDCSIIAGQQYSLVAQKGHLFPGSPACAADPNDPCCHSCGSTPPPGCEACSGPLYLDDNSDKPNLRCFDQKRRFGVDFLYPTARYVNALTKATLCLSRPDLDPANCDDARNLLPNPLLFDGAGGTARDPSLVFFAGIIGVPWQLIQATTDATGTPYPDGELHFQSSAQLLASSVVGGPTGWDRIVGPPTVRDVHMLESVAAAEVGPRPGLPTAQAPLTDPISGHEFDGGGDDLQYTCIFPLLAPRDCSVVDGKKGCDCSSASRPDYTEDNPLCFDGSKYTTNQVAAKAYPGLRPLQALKDFGALTGNSIVASICARNLDAGQSTHQDFGYNPAVDAIVDRLKEKLGDTCQSRRLDLEPIDGQLRGKPACSIVEAARPEADGTCNCDLADARKAPNPNVVGVVRQRMKAANLCTSEDPNCDRRCLCELIPAGGVVSTSGTVDIPAQNYSQYAQCQTVETASVDGWCYVDKDVPVITGEATLNAAKDALVSACPAAEKRILRFQGRGALRKGSTTFVACRGASLSDKPPAVARAGM